MNDSLSKKYLSEVKLLFPILRKEEKTYLRKMRHNIDDYCENSSVQSIDDIYNEFGKPQDVVNDYFSMMDVSSFISSVRFRKILKRVICFICAVTLIIICIHCLILYQEHEAFLRQEVVIIEKNITEP
ncbi:MAG: hypothetical protein K6F93_01460 [Lachnospiraceae bacterium]|nr:hypothetical protein [Lachnospiraceae bacterium]